MWPTQQPINYGPPPLSHTMPTRQLHPQHQQMRHDPRLIPRAQFSQRTPSTPKQQRPVVQNSRWQTPMNRVSQSTTVRHRISLEAYKMKNQSGGQNHESNARSVPVVASTNRESADNESNRALVADVSAKNTDDINDNTHDEPTFSPAASESNSNQNSPMSLTPPPSVTPPLAEPDGAVACRIKQEKDSNGYDSDRSTDSDASDVTIPLTRETYRAEYRKEHGVDPDGTSTDENVSSIHILITLIRTNECLFINVEFNLNFFFSLGTEQSQAKEGTIETEDTTLPATNEDNIEDKLKEMLGDGCDFDAANQIETSKSCTCSRTFRVY